ncbi:hypothetical protein DL766_005954 [Monosporascus sp. MC13-8B]|uniref:Uncharacterized protein n=1 Tax=Monosporascus cannonballus TaxID=155416 RepID=A0ABY0H8Y2_9PEZI|nr:hypothetical protein DL762_004038 [Monosporascus cannonballus]RYO97797.1 hypothetical protein DL763_002593 [Monosporascus cannonballus]RYP28291.1 hypothetical protein DL766_005954 [Monosporascus sp. MC13-8B]
MRRRSSCASRDMATMHFYEERGQEPTTAHYTECAAYTQDSNNLAILAGIANITYAKSTLTYLSDSNVLPYGNAFYDEGGNDLGEAFSTRICAFISYFEIATRSGTGYVNSALYQIHRTYS